MDMYKLQKNLDEALENLDVFIKERDTLKDKYENVKDCIKN